MKTKPISKNKLKVLLSELKKFKSQSILVLEYKKRNNGKIFHSSYKLIACDSDIEEAFKSTHQSIMTDIKNFVGENWVVGIIVRYSVEVFECYYEQK